MEDPRPPSGTGVGLPVRAYHSAAPVYWTATCALCPVVGESSADGDDAGVVGHRPARPSPAVLV